MADNNKDDPFDRVRELLEDLGLEDLQDRLNDLENQLDDMKEDGSNSSPFSGNTPFTGGNPFSGDTPFTGQNPFGGDNPQNPFSGNNPFESLLRSQEEQTGRRLVSEVEQNDSEVAILVDLPEFSEDQIELTATEDRVRVEAESTEDMYHDSVSQVFNLPVEVDPDEGEAEYYEGFLRLTFPRDDEDQTTITIE